MKPRMGNVICFVGALPFILGASDPAFSARIATYSNFCIEAESGDTAGNLIALKHGTGRDRVIFEYSDGAVMEPVEAHNIHFDAKSGTLSFEAVLPSRVVAFRGRVTTEALNGFLKDGAEDGPVRRVHLRRVQREVSPDAMPPCS